MKGLPRITFIPEIEGKLSEQCHEKSLRYAAIVGDKEYIREMYEMAKNGDINKAIAVLFSEVVTASKADKFRNSVKSSDFETFYNAYKLIGICGIWSMISRIKRTTG